MLLFEIKVPEVGVEGGGAKGAGRTGQNQLAMDYRTVHIYKSLSQHLAGAP